VALSTFSWAVFKRDKTEENALKQSKTGWYYVNLSNKKQLFLFTATKIILRSDLMVRFLAQNGCHGIIQVGTSHQQWMRKVLPIQCKAPGAPRIALAANQNHHYQVIKAYTLYTILDTNNQSTVGSTIVYTLLLLLLAL
jgi:hypothetical protein